MSSSSRYSDSHHHHHRSSNDRKRSYYRRDDRDEDEYDDEDRYHRRRHSDSRHKDDERRKRRSRSSLEEDSNSDDEKFKKFGQILIQNTVLERELPLDFELSEMMSKNTLPCFDRERDFEPIEIRRKFFEDARVGDAICCKVLKITSDEVELKPECTLTRYRRCLYRIVFPPTTVITICEVDLLACSRGDLISASISQIDYDNLKICLTINNYGIPLTNNELPAYYRKLPEISLDLPDLNSILGLTPLTAFCSALPELRNKNFAIPNVETLREKLKISTAAKIVVEAAALVREKKNDEGIQLFNEALTKVPNYVPALIGRSAAYANQKYFKKALKDLSDVLSLEPENETGKQYLSTVLMAFGQQMEAEGRLEKAVEKYQEAIEICDDNRARILFSNVKEKIDERNDKLKKKEEKEKQIQQEKLNSSNRKERHENSKKLKEMEKFIESLKKKK